MMKSKYKVNQVVSFEGSIGYYSTEELIIIGTIRSIHKSSFYGIRYDIDGSNLLVNEIEIVGLCDE